MLNMRDSHQPMPEVSRDPHAAEQPRVGEHYRIQAIERAVTLLNAFSADEPELGVTELASRVGLHKSTVHRFLVNLEAGGLVERNPRTGRYRLGIRIFEHLYCPPDIDDQLLNFLWIR